MLKNVLLLVIPKEGEQWRLHEINDFYKKFELIEQFVKKHQEDVKAKEKQR